MLLRKFRLASLSRWPQMRCGSAAGSRVKVVARSGSNGLSVDYRRSSEVSGAIAPDSKRGLARCVTLALSAARHRSRTLSGDWRAVQHSSAVGREWRSCAGSTCVWRAVRHSSAVGRKSRSRASAHAFRCSALCPALRSKMLQERAYRFGVSHTRLLRGTDRDAICGRRSGVHVTPRLPESLPLHGAAL